LTERTDRRAAKSTPSVETRLVVSLSAGGIAAIMGATGFGAWSASNSIGGMSPSELCSRSWFNLVKNGLQTQHAAIARLTASNQHLQTEINALRRQVAQLARNQ
jgi:hypothetical protein